MQGGLGISPACGAQQGCISAIGRSHHGGGPGHALGADPPVRPSSERQQIAAADRCGVAIVGHALHSHTPLRLHIQDTGTRRRQQIAVADGALALATAETLVQNLTYRANATEFRVLPKAVVRGWRLTNAPFGL